MERCVLVSLSPMLVICYWIPLFPYQSQITTAAALGEHAGYCSRNKYLTES
jgi:hypothetical protein